MAKEFSRSDRVAEQIQRELADLLQFEVKDPRIGMVTITEVEVSGDMAHAKIYYSAHAASTELQKGLEKSAGFLRSQLGKRMLLRTVPQLHFIYDASIDRGMRLSRLIDEALAPDHSAPDQTDKPSR
jgi:ribosome-binding factor A